MMSMEKNDIKEEATEKEQNAFPYVPQMWIVPPKHTLMQLKNKGETRNPLSWVNSRNVIYDIEEII